MFATLKPPVVRRLFLAPFLVLLSALAYHGAVHPAFQVIRVPLIDGPRQPTGHSVRVVLPDLSVLRPSVPILIGRLANGPARRQRAHLLLGGVSRAEVELAPGGGGSFALVLSEGTARAITGGAGGQYDVRVAADSDDWRLIALDASNAYAAVGPVVALVPAQVHENPPTPWFAWTLLVVLGTMSLVFGAGANTTRLRRLHQIAAAVMIAALTVAWLLPVTSNRRVLVTPLVFWLAIGVLFLPAIIASARATLPWATLVGAATRFLQRHPTTCERGGILLGLVAMAIVQPVFDVVRASPEFFVARNTTFALAVTVAALIGLGLPLVLLVVERGLRSVAPRAATGFFIVAVATLLALMIHPWLRRRQIAEPWTMAAIAISAGALLAWLAWRVAAMRQFLAALAPAAIVVPVWFFASSDVSGSLRTWSADIRTPPLGSTPPIVLIVFDEFPLHSLLDADGRIDQVRFPHFAALARDASWYRETTAVSSQTAWAVPAIVSGKYPVTPNAVPTLRYYPQNLFTLLADRYEMSVFGRFLKLCPEDACQSDIAGPGDGPLELLTDLGVVWLHIVLPAPLTQRLPPVVGDWRGFAQAAKWRIAGGRRRPNNRRSEFTRFLATMDARPARLYFLHSLLPHMPFEFVPSERRYDAPDYQGRVENGAGLFQQVGPAYADMLQQRHLLQVGFVDTQIGRTVARLKELGLYDRALLIVTADHGASFREGMPRRDVSADNLADIVRVPLFIKRPAQQAGAVVDGLVESVDILPTIADTLGMRLPFQVDGRAVGRHETSDRESRTMVSRSLKNVEWRDLTDWRPSSQISLVRRIARFGTGGYDALYALPGTAELIGRMAADFPHRVGTVRVALAVPRAFANVDITSERLPLHVRARVSSVVPEPLAVVVNGRIVATAMCHQENDASVFSTMIPEHALRPGRNEVAIVLIDRVGNSTTLVSTLP